MTDAESPWMTAKEAAEYARMSVRTVYEHAEDGRLSGVKTTPGEPRSKWLFRRSDVDRWLERGRVARPRLVRQTRAG
jgi:excisionase family DNA binding protein